MFDTLNTPYINTYRDDDDLILILADGSEIKIDDFFTGRPRDSVIVQNAETGDMFQVTLDDLGQVIGVMQQSRTQPEEMFATAANADTPFELTPDTATNMSTQAGAAAAGGAGLNTGVVAGIGSGAVAMGVAVIATGGDNDSDENTSDTVNTNTANTSGVIVVDAEGNKVTPSQTNSDSITVEENTQTVITLPETGSGLIIQNGILLPGDDDVVLNLVSARLELEEGQISTGTFTAFLDLIDQGGDNTLDGVFVNNTLPNTSVNVTSDSAVLRINNSSAEGLFIGDVDLSGRDTYILTIDGNIGDRVFLDTDITATGNTVSGRTEYTGTNLTLYIDPDITVADAIII